MGVAKPILEGFGSACTAVLGIEPVTAPAFEFTSAFAAATDSEFPVKTLWTFLLCTQPAAAFETSIGLLLSCPLFDGTS